MRILFLFFDGIGLGEDDPQINPFAAGHFPALEFLSNGQRWIADAKQTNSERAVFIPTDACLGVDGKPQSASGQAAIMTGKNVPQMIGRHYGPKPDPAITAIIQEHSVIQELTAKGFTASLLNAYPSQYLDSVNNGKRLLSSYQLALHVAGVPLRDGQALLDRKALSADFVGTMWRSGAAEHDAASKVWRTRPGNPDIPVMDPEKAGRLLVELSSEVDMAFFDCWLTDYLGHRGTMEQSLSALETIDGVIGGVVQAWHDEDGIVIITSDHGNLENLPERGHTRNKVPTVVIGRRRHEFARELSSLTDIAPGLRSLFSNDLH